MSPTGLHEAEADLMRSWLLVPGDSARKLARALEAGADALIVDLEDSVAAAAKPEARATAAAFLHEARRLDDRLQLWVRVNALDTGLTEEDLAIVMPARPHGIMLPKSESGRMVTELDARLAVHEAEAGIDDGATRILAIATETAASVFGLGTYARASSRLSGLTWGAEDLSAAIGAEASRGSDHAYGSPFRLVRDLVLFGAVAAGAAPVDGVYTAYKDTDGLRAEAEAARRDGFTAKLAIHPAQVPIINAVFTPDAGAIARARAVVAAFAAEPEAGVVGFNGEMLDRPHLVRAERLLERARAAGLDWT
jgi:citrate lyase subunit beta/citryl-CoA lyase